MSVTEKTVDTTPVLEQFAQWMATVSVAKKLHPPSKPFELKRVHGMAFTPKKALVTDGYSTETIQLMMAAMAGALGRAAPTRAIAMGTSPPIEIDGIPKFIESKDPPHKSIEEFSLVFVGTVTDTSFAFGVGRIVDSSTVDLVTYGDANMREKLVAIAKQTFATLVGLVATTEVTFRGSTYSPTNRLHVEANLTSHMRTMYMMAVAVAYGGIAPTDESSRGLDTRLKYYGVDMAKVDMAKVMRRLAVIKTMPVFVAPFISIGSRHPAISVDNAREINKTATNDSPKGDTTNDPDGSNIAPPSSVRLPMASRQVWSKAAFQVLVGTKRTVVMVGRKHSGLMKILIDGKVDLAPKGLAKALLLSAFGGRGDVRATVDDVVAKFENTIRSIEGLNVDREIETVGGGLATALFWTFVRKSGRKSGFVPSFKLDEIGPATFMEWMSSAVEGGLGGFMDTNAILGAVAMGTSISILGNQKDWIGKHDLVVAQQLVKHQALIPDITSAEGLVPARRIGTLEGGDKSFVYAGMVRASVLFRAALGVMAIAAKGKNRILVSGIQDGVVPPIATLYARYYRSTRAVVNQRCAHYSLSFVATILGLRPGDIDDIRRVLRMEEVEEVPTNVEVVDIDSGDGSEDPPPVPDTGDLAEINKKAEQLEDRIRVLEDTVVAQKGIIDERVGTAEAIQQLSWGVDVVYTRYYDEEAGKLEWEDSIPEGKYDPEDTREALESLRDLMG